MTDSKKLIKVLILWCGTQAPNYGLRVLAEGNKALIQRAFPDARVEVDFQDFGPGDSKVSFGTKSILRDIFRSHGPIKEKLRNYDLIVDSGAGDSFADIYGLKRLSFIFYAHFVIRRMGLPLVFAPQTIGPFNTRFGRLGARKSLMQAELVLSRDSKSTVYSQNLGRSVDATATDVVFALPSGDSEGEVAQDVVINVSGLLWFADDHVHSETYRTATKRLVAELAARGRSVSLLAHVVNSPNGNDDVDAARALTSELEHEVGFAVPIIVPKDLGHARSILGAANVVVGARMHACLNALSMGTPAVPWAYSRKFAPLMSDLGWDLTVDLSVDKNPDVTTLRMIDETNWSEKAKQLDAVRTAADRALDTAANVLLRRLGEVSTDA